MMYFYTVNTGERYKLSGWIEADSRQHAKLLLSKEKGVMENKIEITFEMTKHDWDNDFKRVFQGD